MRAIDTNVLVRFLTADDPRQAQAARGVIEAGKIFIGTTVVLETEWVLRAGYRLSSPEIAAALRGLGEKLLAAAGGPLLVPKQKRGQVTVAVARLHLSPGVPGLGKAPWEVATGILAEVMQAMNPARERA
mgnify:CR=1 FL=1